MSESSDHAKNNSQKTFRAIGTNPPLFVLACCRRNFSQFYLTMESAPAELVQFIAQALSYFLALSSVNKHFVRPPLSSAFTEVPTAWTFYSDSKQKLETELLCEHL